MNTARKLLHDLAIRLTSLFSRFIPDRVPMTLVGAGSSRDLCSAIAQSGTRKLLVVTDAMLVKLGVVEKVTRALAEHGVAWSVYDGVEPDPTTAHVAAGLDLLKREGCEAVLAVGGGSPMDAAKVIAAAARDQRPLRKLEGLLRVRRLPLPLFAIPTTAGTGSEVTIAAVVSDPQTHLKKFFIDPKLLPVMAALDPGLMTGLPAPITAATGMDALTHAVESYLSLTSTRQTERWATTAVRLIFENLPKACADGTNLDVRRAMALASYYAGLAFTRTSVGYVHAIAHQLGAHYRVPHGLANAVVLPHVLEYSLGPATRRLAELGECLGLPGENDEARARAFIENVRSLAQRVQIPATLDALRPQDIPSLARLAVAEAFSNYPVPRYMQQADCEGVIRKLLPAG